MRRLSDEEIGGDFRFQKVQEFKSFFEKLVKDYRFLDQCNRYNNKRAHEAEAEIRSLRKENERLRKALSGKGEKE